jgi:hypothetical protein
MSYNFERIGIDGTAPDVATGAHKPFNLPAGTHLAMPTGSISSTRPFITGGPIEEEDTRTGSRTRYEFEGSYDECFAMRINLRNGGASEIVFEPLKNGNWFVSATMPFGYDGLQHPAVPSLWELDVNLLTVSIYQTKNVRLCLTSSQISFVQHVIEDYNRGAYYRAPSWDPVSNAVQEIIDKAADIPNALLNPGSPLTQQQAAIGLFKSVCIMGTDSAIQFTHVLRRTLTAASPAAVYHAGQGYGKIWTTAEMVSFEGIDPSGWFQSQLDYDAQWLKAQPKIMACSGQKVQVMYEYTAFQLANSLCYDPFYGAQLLNPADI